MRLHEIKLNSNDPDEAKNFYSLVLGLKLNLDEPDLKVFNAGIGNLDLNIYRLQFQKRVLQKKNLYF